MAKNNEESNTLKRSWFTELKGEFRKIIWPDKTSLVKETTAVVIISIVLGCIIALVDWLLQIGLSYIVG